MILPLPVNYASEHLSLSHSANPLSWDLKENRDKSSIMPVTVPELQQRFFEDFGGGPLILDP